MTSAAMLLPAFGSGAPASATVAARSAALRPAVTTVTWHKLTLLNKWQSGQTKRLLTGAPAYAVSGGMVYLSGSLRQLTGSNAKFAVLPRGVRPSRSLYITVSTGNDVAGTLFIEPNGAMFAYGSQSRVLTSLAAVSFPLPGSMTWHPLILLNHWASSQNQWNSGNPGYALKNGIVHLAGSLHLTAGTNHVFGVLPKGYRPPHALYISVYTFASTTGEIRIDPTGTMWAYGPNAPRFVSLAGLSFPTAAIKMHKLPLILGWKSSQAAYNTGDPSYALVGPIVYLSGSMHNLTATSGFAGTLPVAIRPVHVLEIQTYTYLDTYGSIGLTGGSTGFILVGSTPFANAKNYTSFAAISYPRNS